MRNIVLAILVTAATPVCARDLVDQFYEADIGTGKRQSLACANPPAGRTTAQCDQDHLGLYEKSASTLGWQQKLYRARERKDAHAIAFYEAGYARSHEVLMAEEKRLQELYPLPHAKR